MPSGWSLYLILGRGDGAADAARSPRARLGYNPDLATYWQYRRGFARGFLAIRRPPHTPAETAGSVLLRGLRHQRGIDA